MNQCIGQDRAALTLSNRPCMCKRDETLAWGHLFQKEAEIDFSAIVNLMSCPDGIYYLDPDETELDGDEYDYSSYWYAVSWKLVPYTE